MHFVKFVKRDHTILGTSQVGSVHAVSQADGGKTFQKFDILWYQFLLIFRQDEVFQKEINRFNRQCQ